MKSRQKLLQQPKLPQLISYLDHSHTQTEENSFRVIRSSNIQPQNQKEPKPQTAS